MRKHASYYRETDDISFISLTAEEEKNLFATFYGTDEKASDAARERLILQHLKLVAKLSLGYAKRALQDDYAISAGNEGLLQALDCKKFQPGRGARFASYLRSFVRGKVIEALKFNQSDRSKYLLLFNGRVSDDATITGLHAEFGAAPSGRLLAYSPISAWASVANDVNPVVESDVEEIDLANERRKLIDTGLQRCNETEQTVIRMVFMEGYTLSEAQRKMSETKKISRQACQQAYARGMEKLKRFLSCHKDTLSV